MKESNRRIASAVRACAASWTPAKARRAQRSPGAPRLAAEPIVARLLALLCQLADSRDGLSAEELAAVLGSSRPTIQRDIITLRKAGMPLVAVREGRRVNHTLEVHALPT